MTKKRECRLYWDGGENFIGVFALSEKEIKIHKNIAMKNGYVGYLAGYRVSPWSLSESQKVLVFFREKPDEKEILRRRANGFKSAQWHWLLEKE